MEWSKYDGKSIVMTKSIIGLVDNRTINCPCGEPLIKIPVLVEKQEHGFNCGFGILMLQINCMHCDTKTGIIRAICEDASEYNGRKFDFYRVIISESEIDLVNTVKKQLFRFNISQLASLIDCSRIHRDVNPFDMTQNDLIILIISTYGAKMVSEHISPIIFVCNNKYVEDYYNHQTSSQIELHKENCLRLSNVKPEIINKLLKNGRWASGATRTWLITEAVKGAEYFKEAGTGAKIPYGNIPNVIQTLPVTKRIDLYANR